MKFKYSIASTKSGTLTDSSGRIVKRPVLWLVLTGKNGDKIDVPAVIDSGADTTTLNIQYADFLGIKLDTDKQRNIMGIGKGNVPVYQSNFSFKIKEMGNELEVPAWYVDSDNVNILLGQEAFFDAFKIKFEKDHDTFELTSSKK
jgi:hypothetical protein